MNHKTLAAVLLSLLACDRSFSIEPFKTVTIPLNGIPLELSEDGSVDCGSVDERGISIDLAERFKDQGVDVPDEGFVRYNTRTGELRYRLHDEMDLQIFKILRRYAEVEGQLGVIRAYIAVFQPLDDKKRTALALKVGFMPDPLVSAQVNRIRQLMWPQGPWYEDPFADPNPIDKPPELSEEVRATIQRERRLLAALLRVTLKNLSEQVREIEKDKAEQDSSTNRLPDSKSKGK